MERRNFLKTLALAGGAAAAPALGRTGKRAPSDAVGMLYDSTRCIGCKACVVACRESNNLPASATDGRHDLQQSLDGTTKNVIKLWKDDKSPAFAFMKQQCMHCVDPACVSVCMLGALQKGAQGAVTYDKDTCIGCRYCQVACPFGVPQFEWDSATPKIVKCELCPERRAQGREPACVEVCPRKAVIYGKRDELLEEAHRRIDAHPAFYQPNVYGESELGGTQVLYLSAVPFVKLGLPDKGKRSGASVSESIQHGVYQGFIAPVALYAGLVALAIRNRKKSPSPEGKP